MKNISYCLLLTIMSALLLSSIAGPVYAGSGGQRVKRMQGVQRGLAAFYGQGFQGQKTASGEAFDKRELVAAHPSFPLGSLVRVTNLENQRSVIVRINDRGPASSQLAKGVIIDLSRAAAEQLQFIKDGKTRVHLQVVKWGEQD